MYETVARLRQDLPRETALRFLYEDVYCQRGEMESRLKQCQGDLFADRTPTPTMRANQLRLWLSSMAYVLMCALRRIGLAGTKMARATCGTIAFCCAQADRNLDRARNSAVGCTMDRVAKRTWAIIAESPIALAAFVVAIAAIVAVLPL